MKILELKGKKHEDFVSGIHGDMTLEQYLEMPFNETYVKTEGTGKSFALYSKTHKINDNVIANTALVLDVDKSPEPVFDALKTELERMGVDAVIGTTYSNDPDNGIHSLRAVIPFKTPVSKESFPDAGRNFVASSPYITELDNKGLLDHRMFVPSQYWLDPSVHPDRELTARKERTQGGVPLNPDIRKRDKAKSVSSMDTSKDEIIPVGNRNNKLTQICGSLILQYHDFDVVRLKLGQINRTRCAEPLPDRDIDAIVNSIWKIHLSKNPEEFLHIINEDTDIIYRIWSREERLSKKPVSFYVERLFKPEDIAMIAGQSGEGKSFVAVDLACHMSRGMKWFGHEIAEPRPVLYFAFEDWDGINSRLKGWEKHHGVEADVTLMPEELTLEMKTGGKKLVNKFCDDLLEQGFSNGVIIFDTMQYITEGWRENEADDMKLFIGLCKVIRMRLNCLIIIVHHVGKNKDLGSRGSTVLKASMGTELIIENNDTVKVTKVKNSKQGYSYNYSVETIGEGDDETLVITNSMNGQDKKRKLTGDLQIAVRDFIKEQFKTNQAILNKEVEGNFIPSFDLTEIDHMVRDFLKEKDLVKHKNKLGQESQRIISSLCGKPYFIFAKGIDSNQKEFLYEYY